MTSRASAWKPSIAVKAIVAIPQAVRLIEEIFADIPPSCRKNLSHGIGPKSLPLDGGGEVGVIARNAAAAYVQRHASRRECTDLFPMRQFRSGNVTSDVIDMEHSDATNSNPDWTVNKRNER